MFTTFAKGRVTGESRMSAVGDATAPRASRRTAVSDAVGNMSARDWAEESRLDAWLRGRLFRSSTIYSRSMRRPRNYVSVLALKVSGAPMRCMVILGESIPSRFLVSGRYEISL